MDEKRIKSMPEDLDDTMLVYLAQFHDNPDGRVWAKVSELLSQKQVFKVLDYVQERERQKLNYWKATVTQEQEDALFRAGAIHFARDFNYLPFTDEFDIVNKEYKKKAINDKNEMINLTYAKAIVKHDQLGLYMGENETFTFFSDENSPFSSCSETPFKVRDLSFISALQYVQYCKAEQFRDRAKMEALMKASDHAQILRLGRQVKFFERIVWNMVLGQIIRVGMYEKFNQNPHIKARLFQTKGTTIVYASASDLKWGCGFEIQNKERLSRRLWPGRNLLGEILTETRVKLMGEY